MTMTLKYPQIQSQMICFSEGACPKTCPSISMLTVLHIITCIYDHSSPKFSMQTPLQMVGLITEELLPVVLP